MLLIKQIIENRFDSKSDLGLFEEKFQIVYNGRGKKNEENSIKELAKWCANNFLNNYVLVANSTEIISGGCMNNKTKFWKPHEPRIVYYLNCFSSDAVLFKLTWTITLEPDYPFLG